MRKDSNVKKVPNTKYQAPKLNSRKAETLSLLGSESPKDLKEDLQGMFKLLLGSPQYIKLPDVIRQNYIESYFTLASMLDRLAG